MRHLDLFSGIGGFALAAQWAGFTTVGFSEIDPYCCELLSERFPLIPNYGDITNADFSELAGTIDLLTGGFPCQPFSLLGKKLGERDSRNLWPHMFRVIKQIQPSWVVCENVLGAKSYIEKQVIPDLLGEGYDCTYLQIQASDVGASHRRQRLWPVAYSDSKPSIKANKGTIAEQKERHSRQGYSRQAWDGFPRDYWEADSPRVWRMDDGLPEEVDRLKALGNSIVPQVAYQILKAINP